MAGTVSDTVGSVGRTPRAGCGTRGAVRAVTTPRRQGGGRSAAYRAAQGSENCGRGGGAAGEVSGGRGGGRGRGPSEPFTSFPGQRHRPGSLTGPGGGGTTTCGCGGRDPVPGRSGGEGETGADDLVGWTATCLNGRRCFDTAHEAVGVSHDDRTDRTAPATGRGRPRRWGGSRSAVPELPAPHDGPRGRDGVDGEVSMIRRQWTPVHRSDGGRSRTVTAPGTRSHCAVLCAGTGDTPDRGCRAGHGK